MSDCVSLPNAAELVENIHKELALIHDGKVMGCSVGTEFALVNAADAIEALLAENAKLKAEMDAAPQWISVKERLPEKTCEILCYANGSVFNAQYDESINDDFSIGFWEQYFDHDTYGVLGSGWNPCDDVTHWMPLPEPPKEEE